MERVQRSKACFQKKVIRRYMNQRASNGPTISFDEFGPLEVRPQPGQSWCPTRRPKRWPATYTRKHGVRHWLAFYDVHANFLWGYTRRRKRAIEILEVLKLMRRRYPPKQRIHLILDNLSAHGTPEIQTVVPNEQHPSDLDADQRLLAESNRMSI